MACNFQINRYKQSEQITSVTRSMNHKSWQKSQRKQDLNRLVNKLLDINITFTSGIWHLITHKRTHRCGSFITKDISSAYSSLKIYGNGRPFSSLPLEQRCVTSRTTGTLHCCTLLETVGGEGAGITFLHHLVTFYSFVKSQWSYETQLLRALLHSFISSVQTSRETSLELKLLKTTQARDLIAVEECTL